MSIDLHSLNHRQQEAVTASDKALLIIAGPGTGKTYTLAHRIAYLLKGTAEPHSSILALTFTAKAAQEMRERVSQILQEEGACEHDDRPWIGTFHALGLEILRNEGKRLGILSEFRILSESEQIELVKEVLSQTMPSESLARVKKWIRLLSDRKNGLPPDSSVASSPLFELSDRLFNCYQSRLKDLAMVDFDDLILMPLTLFKEHPDVKAAYQNRIHHILVDEFQDINNLQYEFLNELLGPQTSLWAIGDADQAIYAFRGANVHYFLRFQKDHPSAKTITLEYNYRSAPPILIGAQSVIAYNTNRLSTACIPTITDVSSPITLFTTPHEKAEARCVVHEIERLIGGFRMESPVEGPDDVGFNDIAILYRFHHLRSHFAENLKQAGIPYQLVDKNVAGSDSPFSNVTPYLEILVNPHNDPAFRTLFPRVDKTFSMAVMHRLSSAAQNKGMSLYTLLSTSHGKGLLETRQEETVTQLISLLKCLQIHLQTGNLKDVIADICQGAHIPSPFDSQEQAGWLVLAEPFFTGSAAEKLSPFLETLSLLKEGETYNPRAEAVTLMTVHAAKGLEFPIVFMVGLESGIFPATEFGDTASNDEEERRLFYVGMTRARKRLFLSYARERYLFGEKRERTPSPFVYEVSPEVVETCPVPSQSEKKKKPKSKQLSLFSR
ncbi:MAG: ATP-dependent helicase [Deltaproteobacteria bacterium]|nr:ATP-dependent helicase [Deltaproteobacteria bacterium]